MSLQIAGDIVDVDAAQLVTLHQLLVGQTFGLVLLGQLIDSGNDLVHVHLYYLTNRVYIYRWITTQMRPFFV